MPDLAPLPTVAPWPQGATLSWPKTDTAPRHEALDLRDALTRRWDTDAHTTGYTLPGEAAWPRLHKSALHVGDADGERLGDHARLAVVFTDWDRPGHEPWPDTATRSAAMGLMSAVFPEATIYGTRAGLRLVFLPAEPPTLAQAEAWLILFRDRHLWPQAKALGSALPVELDLGTFQWSRGYRLPRVVRDGRITDSDIIDRLDRRLHWSPPAEALQSRATAEWVHLDDAECPEDPTPPPDWTAWVHRGSKAGRVMDDLVAGRPIAEPGSRNTTLHSVLNSIAAQLRRGSLDDPNPGDLYSIVAASVAADTTDGAPTLAEAWAMAVRVAEKERTDRAAKAEQRAQVAEARRITPVIVKIASSYYVAGPGGDFSPTRLDAAGLPWTIRDMGLEHETAKGQPLKAAQLMNTYAGQNGDSLRYSLSPPVQAWDPHTRTLTICAVDAPDIQPEYDHLVERWLDTATQDLPGVLRQRFLVWLATVTRTDQPTAALYVEGRHGTGKSMLASALASVWRREAVPFEAAIDTFNIDLVRCPVVHLDEGVADLRLNRAASARFRTLVGNSTHPVHEKFGPRAHLTGCPRVVVTANNPGALVLTGRHGSEDMAAIAQRILHVPFAAEAATFLRQLGGRRGTADWVLDAQGHPGRIARHLMHMAEHMAAEPTGDRFLVAGLPTAYHVRLLTRHELHSQVLVALAVALAPDTPSAMPGGPGVHAPGSETLAEATVLVNPRALHKRWKTLIQEDRPQPTWQELADTLSALSYDFDTVDADGTPCWRIPGSLILQASRDLGYGRLGALEAALLRGTPRTQGGVLAFPGSRVEPQGGSD